MTDVSFKNPCLECDHHLQGGDKNARECMDCEKRIAYVNAIGGLSYDSICQDGEDKNELKKDSNKKTTLEKTEDLQSEKDKFIEYHIKSLCKDAGVTIEQIRAGIQGCHDDQKRQEFNEIRDRIIESLAGGKFGKLNQVRIGKFLGITGHMISCRFKKMGIKSIIRKPKKSEPLKKEKTKRLFETAFVHTSTKLDIKELTLNFSDYPEIYEELQTLADQELRTIENQVLYILKEINIQNPNFKKL